MPRKKRGTFNPKKEVSVLAWIENDSSEVLFVRQAGGLVLWTFPGGKVKRNESLERALKREVREETGLKVSDLSYLEDLRSAETRRDHGFILGVGGTANSPRSVSDRRNYGSG